MKKEIFTIVLGVFISLNSNAQVTSIVENFDGTTGSNLPIGWAGSNIQGSNFGTGNFYSDHTTNTGRFAFGSNGFISTELLAAGNYMVSYWMRISSFPTETFKLGFCTDQQNIAGTFTQIQTVTNSSNVWTNYQSSISLATNAYLAWSFIGLSKTHAIDDVNIQLTSSIAENSAQPTFATYPNPSNGRFTVLQPEGNNFDIRIENLNGQVVYKTKNQSQRLEIDLAAQPKGVYILKVLDDNNSLKIQKIVLQ